ncbi:hypothetical protein [Vannielia litorea]|uniref:hypothetical protein n=1 Tax=Vannielia litorea TaxID=1217970 RepID=UPI001BCB8E81|nr:hypothetical protein [Vannielia litorea]MBS8228178.1 hypothetical protein [Vannielia litorea]
MISDTSESSRSGFPKRRVVCDDCGATSDLVAAEKTASGEAQARRKVAAEGWTYVKHKDRCASCEAQRKEKPVNSKSETPPPNRQPTRADKRQIMSALSEFYDEDAQRYSGGETDTTMAQLIGDGILPGWVAQVREEFFGPAGNEEIASLVEESAQLAATMEAKARSVDGQIREAIASLRDLNKMRGDLDKMRARIEKLRVAIGPKAMAV